jgi:hypothetical protein
VSELTPPENQGAGDETASLEPAAPAKPKGSALFALLGFFTPVALLTVMTTGQITGAFLEATPWIFGAHLVFSIAAWIAGRQLKKPRLRSYGLGAVVFYALVGLLLLLLWGTCMVGQ